MVSPTESASLNIKSKEMYYVNLLWIWISFNFLLVMIASIYLLLMASSVHTVYDSYLTISVIWVFGTLWLLILNNFRVPVSHIAKTAPS